MAGVGGSRPGCGDGGVGGGRSGSQAAGRMRRKRKEIKREEVELREKSVGGSGPEIMVKSDPAYCDNPSLLSGPFHNPVSYMLPPGSALPSTMNYTHYTATYQLSSETSHSAPMNPVDVGIHSLRSSPAFPADLYLLPNPGAPLFTGPSPNLLGPTETNMMVRLPNSEFGDSLADPGLNCLHPATSYMASTKLTSLYPTYLNVNNLGRNSLDPTNSVLTSQERLTLDQQDVEWLASDQDKVTRREQMRDRGRGRKAVQEQSFMYQLLPQQDPKIEQQRQQAVRAKYHREKGKQQMKQKLQQTREIEAEVASLKDEKKRLQQSIANILAQCMKP